MSQASRNAVIVAVSPGPHAKELAAAGKRWADWLEAALVLLHAGDRDASAASWLEELAAGVGGSRVSTDLRRGDPRRVVPRAAVELGASLIIAGAGQEPNAAASVSGQVARRASCSVLLIPAQSAAPREGQRWVVGTQCVDAFRPLLRFAGDLALRASPGRIDVVSAYCLRGADLALEGDLDDRAADSQRDRFRHEEQARLAEFVADSRMGAVNVRVVSLFGLLGPEAVTYARTVDAGLVIVRAPPPSGVWVRLFGEEDIVAGSLPCPLWLYRARASEDGRG